MKNKTIHSDNTENAAQKLLGLTLKINKNRDSLNKVEFCVNKYGAGSLELTITHNNHYKTRKELKYGFDENANNKYSLETLIKLLEEILKTNMKYKDLVNQSKYDIDTFLENIVENISASQEVPNDK